MSTKKLNGTVIVSYRCNARCNMCNRFKAPSKPEEEITVEAIKKLPEMYFTNITGGKIANIPLVSIKKEHQGKGLAKHLIKKSVETLLNMVQSGERMFTEVNVSAETNNIPALKMYRHIGFKEDYSYPQSYLPKK